MDAVTPRKRDRVLVTAQWSSFFGQRGTVQSVAPLMIIIDGDTFPMRFGERECIVDAPTSPSLTGAE